RGTRVGVFIDVNSGMNRTGISEERTGDVIRLARDLGAAFRGLHWYDGHISNPSPDEREKQAHAGYGRLLAVVHAIEAAGIPDAGVPTCVVMGHAEYQPLKPSEEHLPIEIPPGVEAPAIGGKLYLIPRHVCPTVNNFDEALMVRGGRVAGVEPVTARGHEHPLV